VEPNHLKQEAAQAGGFGAYAFDLVLLHGEDLDDADTVHGFVDDGGHTGYFLQRTAHALAHFHADFGQYQDDQGHAAHADEGEKGVGLKGIGQEEKGHDG